MQSFSLRVNKRTRNSEPASRSKGDLAESNNCCSNSSQLQPLAFISLKSRLAVS